MIVRGAIQRALPPLELVDCASVPWRWDRAVESLAELHARVRGEVSSACSAASGKLFLTSTVCLEPLRRFVCGES